MGFINKNAVDTYKLVLGIGETEAKVLLYLINTTEEQTINELKDECLRDRTTIQKAVKVLFEKGLIAKKKYGSSDVEHLRQGWCLKYYLEKDCFDVLEKKFKEVEQEMKEYINTIRELEKEYFSE
jgi:predicted transcriptional regulator